MTDFCPAVGPEDIVPKQIAGCRGCGLYKHNSRMIWGEGNPRASVMIILDNPGDREDRKTGSPFVCGTRQTLQFAAKESGFKPEDLYTTYLSQHALTLKKKHAVSVFSIFTAR